MILLQLFLVSVSSLSVLLEQKPTCFFVKTYEDNTTLTVSYLISGLDETKSVFFIESETEDVLIWIEGEKEKILKQVLQTKGTYYLCFQSKDKSYKMVSFDFDLEGIDKNYAQSDQFDQLNKKLQDTSRNFQSIYRNQHWQSDRENAHALILEQTEKSVQWCAVIKISVLILISGIQIYVVYTFFKDKTFGPSV